MDSSSLSLANRWPNEKSRRARLFDDFDLEDTAKKGHTEHGRQEANPGGSHHRFPGTCLDNDGGKAMCSSLHGEAHGMG